MKILCFLCMCFSEGPPVYEKQSLPDGLMLRACGDCWKASPSVERIEEAATAFVAKGGRQ